MAQETSRSADRTVLLFDVMDTIVTDPFYEHMPKHFGMTFKELLAAKHPTTWLRFEKGHCSEEEAMAQFFADGRTVDAAALRAMMVEQYAYLPGIEALLQQLKQAGHEMHVVSNYPVWHRWIEDKLELSQYMPWTFVSCEGPMQGLRKPDMQVYERVCQHLSIDASQAIFVDDRPANVDAAHAAGMRALHMTGTDKLVEDLRAHGVGF